MSSATQIANSFIVEFFERFAKNPAQLAELYGSNSCLTFNDFELGLRELFDAEVPRAAIEYAETLQGSQLRVDSVNAAPLHGGVSIFAIVSAQSEAQQQYFHFTTVLEAYPSAFGSEGYFIRHQIIARIGSIAQEVQQPEPEAPVEEPKEVEAPAPAPAAAAPAAPKAKTPEPEPVPVEEPVQEEEPAPAAAPAPAPAAPAPAAKPAKAAEAPAPSGPKSWASIAMTKKSADTKQVVRVVAATEKEKAPAAAAAVVASAPAAAAKEAPKRVRKQAVGDRLMFNIDEKVTDEEIHKAFGPVAASIVSLRNNSEKGNVFVDFAEGVDAMEELKNVAPVLGEQKTKIVIRRQRDRAERQQQ